MALIFLLSVSIHGTNLLCNTTAYGAQLANAHRMCTFLSPSTSSLEAAQVMAFPVCLSASLFAYVFLQCTSRDQSVPLFLWKARTAIGLIPPRLQRMRQENGAMQTYITQSAAFLQQVLTQRHVVAMLARLSVPGTRSRGTSSSSWVSNGSSIHLRCL